MTLAVADLLSFESGYSRHSDRKEQAIRAELGVTPVRLYQLLNRAIDTREALEHDPMLTLRLRRLRDRRRAEGMRRRGSARAHTLPTFEPTTSPVLGATYHRLPA